MVNGDHYYPENERITRKLMVKRLRSMKKWPLKKHLNFRRCQCAPLVQVSFLPRLWCPLWSARTGHGTVCRSDTWPWEVSVAGKSGALEWPMTFQIDNKTSGNRSFFLHVFLSLRKLMENLTWSMMVHVLGTTDYTIWSCDTVLGHQSQVFFPANCCIDSLRNPYAYANPYGVPYWRWRFHYFWCSKWLESSHEVGTLGTLSFGEILFWPGTGQTARVKGGRESTPLPPTDESCWHALLDHSSK